MTAQTVAHALITTGMVLGIIGMSILIAGMIRYEWRQDFGSRSVRDGEDTEQVG